MALDQQQQEALLAQVAAKDKLRVPLSELDDLLGAAIERGEGRARSYVEPGDITDEALWARVVAAVNGKWEQIALVMNGRPTL